MQLSHQKRQRDQSGHVVWKLVLVGLEERGVEQKACSGDFQGMSGYQRGQRNSRELFFLGTGDVIGKVMVP